MIDILQTGDELYIKNWNLDYIIGIDEAGRGTLAGPVVASAVAISSENLFSQIWHQEPLQYIKDSKKVTPKRRQAIYDNIQNQNEVLIGIVSLSAHNIDTINILEATKIAWLEALERCLLQLPLDSKIGILIDGNIIPSGIEYPHQAVIKGDNKHLSIALASIYAKVYRDNIMTVYHTQYPNYGFNENKGYGTKLHIEAIQKYGITDIHRVTFCKNYNLKS